MIKAIEAVIIAAGSLSFPSITFADVQTCSVNSNNFISKDKKNFSLLSREHPLQDDGAANEYLKHCDIWKNGVPLEHLDTACDRVAQNIAWAASIEAAKHIPEAELIPSSVYLNLPEEKTWVCPLESSAQHDINQNNFINTIMSGEEQLGHPTKWILHNRASTSLILLHVNALGLEVSAIDFETYPAHSNTAVYPNGPIVLPGQMAVVEGRQGQLFTAREYKEDGIISSIDALSNPVLESFKNVIPSTWSFSNKQTRYTTKNEVMHVLGHPGRVLMKHRMGMIYIKNESGALCPEASRGLAGDDGRRGNPTDLDPDCNVLRKGFVNKVGCPVDLYFSPQRKDSSSFNCEKFTGRLGSIEAFDSTPKKSLDASGSPIIFQNTYNSHTYVARMAHDQSFVAKIELMHDIVQDCPEPKRSAISVEVQMGEMLLAAIPSTTVSNITESVNGYNLKSRIISTKANVTSPRAKIETFDWQNSTIITPASVQIAS